MSKQAKIGLNLSKVVKIGQNEGTWFEIGQTWLKSLYCIKWDELVKSQYHKMDPIQYLTIFVCARIDETYIQ